MIWSTTQESLGGKFLGAAADVADKVAKRLAGDYQAATKLVIPRQSNKGSAPNYQSRYFVCEQWLATCCQALPCFTHVSVQSTVRARCLAIVHVVVIE